MDKTATESRRRFLKVLLAGSGALLSGGILAGYCRRIAAHAASNTARGAVSETFIAKAASYDGNLTSVIGSALKELGITSRMIKGKNIVLKPNLVETHIGTGHINTHPAVVLAAAGTFRRLGATTVVVAEGPGHTRDSILVLEESGLADLLYREHIPFVDLNYDNWVTVSNTSRISRLNRLTLPVTLARADWIVSMAKMKTHHWVGVTLSMKNLFGVMPGAFYGWPKNALHMAGIEPCILDINAVVRPHLAIVDGILGMEGDGPIMGRPKHAGVLVLGKNLTAVDATCCRIMDIAPEKVTYLAAASLILGPVNEAGIRQRGERVSAVRTRFALVDDIPAHRRLRS
ncbi:MAG: DUF362 domain-containing protein [Deltaproteobacteria bacterium]|nr:DUF362 domain-containing protein [Deltaproteobacteria bacterium]